MTQAAARQFVRRYVGANDMVAVVTTGGGTAAAQEFTSSQARLIAAIDKFMGQKTTRDAVDMERVMKARNTYETLRNVVEFLAPVHGRRKAIIWFSEGVDYDIGNPSVRDSDVVRSAMTSVITAANRANVTRLRHRSRAASAPGSTRRLSSSHFPTRPIRWGRCSTPCVTARTASAACRRIPAGSRPSITTT